MSIPQLPNIYQINSPERIDSPSLIVFQELLDQNLNAMIKMAQQPERLRPHCKTHKMSTIIKNELQRGIRKHKAATFAEAEMLANAGVDDVFLAYNLIGPAIDRAIAFRKKFPNVRLSVTADDLTQIEALSRAMEAAGTSIDVILDINPGRDRTGLPLGESAKIAYAKISKAPGLRAAGLHLYDGHLKVSDLDERKAAVNDYWQSVSQFRDSLQADGFPVEKVICGGTPTFPAYAEINDDCIELSPGTCVYHDAGYGENFPDLDMFTPAALVMTRVISRPTANRITFDLGTKAIASDPAMGERAIFPAIPDGVQVLQNEEHLVIETASAEQWKTGDWTLAIPRHVCPTSVLYPAAIIISKGEQIDEWPIDARDRRLTI
ncbi:D-threonine aldolase [Thalassoglobus neptunius]|uniref:D-threonine aldolase n=1 Tax=Thalassoglobus neptunius TaxID=1938619 RepID=A0A5C5WN27_9PLAN|nr:D-TA family PLP-dependent enzyme [Thalassoglobus neptunius]TWT51489.1 D-threonine aldolase [Thalassoglobus neptunius]